MIWLRKSAKVPTGLAVQARSLSRALLMELQTALTHSRWEPVSALKVMVTLPPGSPPPSSISFFASSGLNSQKSPHSPSWKPPSSPSTGEVQSVAGVRVFWKIVSVICFRSIAMDRPWRTFLAPSVFHAGS